VCVLNESRRVQRIFSCGGTELAMRKPARRTGRTCFPQAPQKKFKCCPVFRSAAPADTGSENVAERMLEVETRFKECEARDLHVSANSAVTRCSILRSTH